MPLQPGEASHEPARIIGFWAMKGGVGRSVLLANFAAYLAEQGRRVIAVDLDTEAPTLEYVFGVGPLQRIRDTELPRVHGQHFLAPGVRHGGMSPTEDRLNAVLIDVYAEIEKYPLDPQKTILDADEQAQIRRKAAEQRRRNDDQGPIWLLPARYDPDVLSKLVYTDEAVVKHLGAMLVRVAASKRADVILLDLRSGMSDAAAWWLGELAGVVVVTTVSTQSMLGTLEGILDFARTEEWTIAPQPIINRVPVGVSLDAPAIASFRRKLLDAFSGTVDTDGFGVPVLRSIEELGFKDALMWLVDGKTRNLMEEAFKGLRALRPFLSLNQSRGLRR